jgi:hypothetical protein
MVVEIWKADLFDDTDENTATQYDGVGIIYGKRLRFPGSSNAGIIVTLD